MGVLKRPLSNQKQPRHFSDLDQPNWGRNRDKASLNQVELLEDDLNDDISYVEPTDLDASNIEDFDPSELWSPAVAGGSSPPKRLRGSYSHILEDNEVEDTPTSKDSNKTAYQRKSIPVEVEKVRLTTNIRKDLHIRFRIHALKVGKSQMQIIEDWVEAYCPE